MTDKLSRAKDAVAKNYNKGNWFNLMHSSDWNKNSDKYINEAISLYHQTELEEAQKELPAKAAIKRMAVRGLNVLSMGDWVKAEASKILTVKNAKIEELQSELRQIRAACEINQAHYESSLQESKSEVEILKKNLGKLECPYCPECQACGESGCCSPTNCKKVQCHYGEYYLSDYALAIELADKIYNEFVNGNKEAESKYSELYGKLYNKHMKSDT